MRLSKITNKAGQVLPLTFTDGSTVHLQASCSVSVEERLVSPQIKNLEQQKLLKISRI